MSNRKTFNDCAGDVASKINALTGISNVIYIASEAGIDASQKYVTVCEAHHQMIASSSIPNARIDMKDASQWCEACQRPRVSSHCHDHLCRCPGCDPDGPEPTEEEAQRIDAEMEPEPNDEPLRVSAHFQGMMDSLLLEHD